MYITAAHMIDNPIQRLRLVFRSCTREDSVTNCSTGVDITGVRDIVSELKSYLSIHLLASCDRSRFPIVVSPSGSIKRAVPMAAAMRASLLFLAAAMIVGCAVSGAMADDMNDLDFMTELQQRQEFDADDFVFKFKKTSDKTPFGNLRPMFVDFNAALATLPGDGASQNLVTVGPCAINQPHNHPRATQISHVTEGELLFGFAEENGGRSFIGGNVTKGQTVIIPQGVIHFAQNLGCKEAQFIASFPHRDPGTQTTAVAFFNLPIGAIRATTGLSDSEIKKILASVSSNPNPSLDKVCAKKCGIKY